MRQTGIVVGLLLALSGFVWILQGLDVAFAPKTFMTDNRPWILRGSLAVVAGLLLAGWSSRKP